MTPNPNANDAKATVPLPNAAPAGEPETVPLPGDARATVPLPGPAHEHEHTPTALPARIGRFEVRAHLGSGAFGDVYRAYDPQLDREVALKVAKPGTLDTPERVGRFLREAKSAANLRHPNIVPLYETGRDGDRLFIASAYIAGRTLEAVIQEANETGALLPPDDAARIVRKLADALAYAHKQGIVHRDVKPANVIVDETGEPLLLDFGLSARAEAGDEKLSGDGQALGTPAYMAPEQAEGSGIATSDQYSLGCTLYELLTGQTPFAGGPAQQLFLHKTQPMPSVRKARRDVPRDLETVLAKCVEKEPERRYASCAALAEDLRRFLDGEPVQARRIGPLERAARWAKRNPAVATALGGVVVAVLVAVYGVVAASRSGERARATDEEAAVLQSLPDEWTAPELERIDVLVSNLGAREPDRAARVRAKVTEALFESGQRRLQRPTLEAADEEYARRASALLRPRAAEFADRLDRALRDRQRDWVRLFLIEPRDATAPGAFHPQRGGAGAVARTDPPRIELPTAFGPSERPVHLIPVATPGDAELRVAVRAGWDAHEPVGAALNVPDTGTGGYVAVLRVGPKPGVYTFELSRNGANVRRQELGASVLRGSSTTVSLQRTGDSVLAQVNGAEPLSYRDVFPLSGGSFAVAGGAGVSVLSVEGRKRAVSTAPSSLERGDELFQTGDWPGALAFYEQEARTAVGTGVEPLARFKAAVVLMNLKRLDEAHDRLQDLHASGHKLVTPLAGCYLVVVLVRRNELDGASRLLDRLTVELAALDPRAERAELLSRLPDDVREEIVTSHRRAAGGIGWYRDDPARVGKLERLLRAEEALGVRPEYVGWSRLAYLRALRAAPEPESRGAAARALREWLTSDYPAGEPLGFGALFAAEYAWVCREAGAPADALAELDRRLFSAPGTHRPDALALLVERARVRYALNDPAAAERDLNEYFRLCPAETRAPRTAADAALMLGLLRERRGDRAGARAVWSEGVPARPLSDPGFVGEVGGSIGLLTAVALMALTERLGDAEFEALARHVLKSHPEGELVLALLQKDDLPAAAELVRGAANRPDFREQLRHLAFQTLPFREYARAPLLVGGTEVARAAAFGGAPTPEQEALAAATAAACTRAFAENRLGRKHVAMLALTARGSRDAFGWGQLEKALAPDLRGPLAYLLGHRFLRLNKPDDARAFFRTADADAPAGSSLKALASAELTKLSPKK